MHSNSGGRSLRDNFNLILAGGCKVARCMQMQRKDKLGFSVKPPLRALITGSPYVNASSTAGYRGYNCQNIKTGHPNQPSKGSAEQCGECQSMAMGSHKLVWLHRAGPAGHSAVR